MAQLTAIDIAKLNHEDVGAAVRCALYNEVSIEGLLKAEYELYEPNEIADSEQDYRLAYEEAVERGYEPEQMKLYLAQTVIDQYATRIEQFLELPIEEKVRTLVEGYTFGGDREEWKECALTVVATFYL